MITGLMIDVMIALSPLFLNNSNVLDHVKKAMSPQVWFNTKTTPKYVAAPFPPLKSWNKGNICPRSAMAPQANPNACEYPSMMVNPAVRTPLHISNVKVSSAASLFLLRAILVAPGFLDP